MEIRALQFAALLLFACSFFQVSRCWKKDTEMEADGDFDITGSLVAHSLSTHKILNRDVGYNHTTETFDIRRKLLGVDTVEASLLLTACIFPNESGRSFVPGENYSLWLTVKNYGKTDLLMIAILGRIYLPHDHDYPVQKLTPKGYIHEYIKPSATRMFPYSFVVSHDLKVGKYDLVGTLLYVMLMDFKYSSHNTTFYNGTIKIVESPVVILVNTIIVYSTLGISFLVFLSWGCKKLYQKWEDKKKAKIAQEEAEMQWLLEEKPRSLNHASSSKNKKSKKN